MEFFCREASAFDNPPFSGFAGVSSVQQQAVLNDGGLSGRFPKSE
jgi:hypothetical protein